MIPTHDVNWAEISDDPIVIDLIKLVTELEELITSIDETALLNWQLYLLSKD